MHRRWFLFIFAFLPVGAALSAEQREPATEPKAPKEWKVHLASMRPMAGVAPADRDAVREMIRIRLVAAGLKVVLAEQPSEGETCDSECVAEEAAGAEADFSLVVTLAKLESEFLVTAELTEVEGAKTQLARSFRVKAGALEDTALRIAGLVHEKAVASGKMTDGGSRDGLQVHRKYSEEMTIAAAVGGFIFPGLGHVILGEGKEGALFAAGWLGVLYYFIGVASPHYMSASKHLKDLPNDSFTMYALTRSYGYDPIATNSALTLMLYRREERLREESLNRVRREATGVYAAATVLVIASLADLFLHHLFDVRVAPEPKGTEVKVGLKVRF